MGEETEIKAEPGRFEQRCPGCQARIGIPFEQDGEKVKCPQCDCEFEALVTEQITKVMERTPDYEGTRKTAAIISGFGSAVLVLMIGAMVIGLYLLMTEAGHGGGGVLEVGGGCLMLGIALKVWSRLVFIQAAIEEANYLTQRAQRTQRSCPDGARCE